MPKVLAPCGMDCRLCLAYQRKNKPCPGCGNQNEGKPAHCVSCGIKNCATLAQLDSPFCAACPKKCRRLKQLDARYREKYHMSLLENLDYIKEKGPQAFLAAQDERWTCAECGTLVSIHHHQCDNCGTPLVEKPLR